MMKFSEPEACTEGQDKDESIKLMGTRDVYCFALKKIVPLKGVMTGVVVKVKVYQLKGKIPGVCDARHSV